MADVQVLDNNIYEQRARRRMDTNAGEAGIASQAENLHQASESFVPLSKGEDEEEEGREGNVDSMETDEEPASGSRIPSSTMEKSPGVVVCLRQSQVALLLQGYHAWNILCFVAKAGRPCQYRAL